MFPVRGGDFLFWPIKFEAHNPKLILGWLNITNNMNSQCKAIPNIAGKWNTSYGELTFRQEGNNVSGTYYSGSGKITGTLDGNVLTGDFVEPKGPGRVRFTFSSDANSFDGRWGWGSAPLADVWNGTRVR